MVTSESRIFVNGGQSNQIFFCNDNTASWRIITPHQYRAYTRALNTIAASVNNKQYSLITGNRWVGDGGKKPVVGVEDRSQGNEACLAETS
jgi:hypothetical protein